MDGLLGARPREPPLNFLRDGLELLRREEDRAAEDHLRLRVQAEHELGDDAKVGSAAAYCPKEVCILCIGGGEDGAVRCDDRHLR